MRIRAVRGENLASLAAFDLDFDAEPLRSAGLFAISGPTGAGKSTLLDAICLALFDALPRLADARAGVSGRGDGADDGLRLTDVRGVLRHGAGAGFAEVDFVGVDGRDYRARWSVRRARRRADGALQPRTLELFDGDGAPIETTLSDAKRAIAARVGLSFDQFRRAALLAQGEFDAFLTAGPKERAELLERVTGAEIYARLSKAAHRRAAQENQRLDTLRAQAEAHEVLAPDARAAAEDLLTTAQAARMEAAATLAAAEHTVRWAERRATAAESAAASDRAVAAAEAERWRIRALAHVAATRAVRDAQTVRDADAAWLSERPALIQLADRIDEAAAAIRVLSEARASADACRAALTAAQQALDAAQAERAGREPELEARRAETAAAEAAVSDARNALSTEDASALQAQRATLEQIDRAIERARAAAREGRAAKRLIDQATADATTAETAAAEAGDVMARLDAELPGLRAAAEAATNALSAWRVASDDAATALRAALEPGAPCPVCGATDHAADAFDAAVRAQRATLDDEARRADAEAREAAESRRAAVERQTMETRRAADARSRAEDQAAVLQDARRAWRESVDQLTTVDAPAEAVAGAIDGLTRAEDREAALDALADRTADERRAVETGLADIEALRKTLDSQTETAERARAALRSTEAAQAETTAAISELSETVAHRSAAASAASATLEERLLRVDAALGDAVPDWRDQSAEAATNAARRAAQTVIDRRDRLRATDAALPELRAHLEEMAPGVDGPDPDDADPHALDALRTPRAARAAIADAETEATKARAAAELAAQTLREVIADRPDALAADAAEDVATLAAARNVAAQTVARSEADENDAAVALKLDDAKRAARADALDAWERRRAEADIWLQLDDLIGSADGAKFRRYAQALTLRQLVALANRQLADLHPRYRLEVAPGDSDDLALQAIDRDMGDERRGVQNLSGGERFLVSLALALGLAALSTERGVRVESLFIDEGFGALDPDSLSMAISALEALQATGRRIGVISHVEEMKERIATRIEVRPEGGGRSRIIVRGPGA